MRYGRELCRKPYLSQLMKYYPQIDGLRAIAVLAVVLFHLGVPGFSGGFTGVDVFFVLSGYLITSHLLHEAETGKISLGEFYERRARRILPVLVAVMAFSLCITAFLYDTNTFRAVGTSIAGCSAFISNLVFMRRKGYFDPAVHEDPLLHTWSLSVEEQFYIFLPLCIILLYRFSKKPGTWILVMAVLSLAANLFVTSLSQNAAFYLSPTRAWEFLAGSLLSAEWLPKANDRQVRSFISIAGMCCIAIAICLYNDQLAFPGIYALLPVLGACAVIYGCIHGKNIFASLLSWKPVVFVGRISYSLYMWHWPLLVFGNMCVADRLSGMQCLVFLVLLFPVATLSYYYIEQPIRRKKILKKRAGLLAASFVILCGFLATGIFIKHGNGLNGPMPADPDWTIIKDPKWTAFDRDQKAFPYRNQYYRIGNAKANPCFVLWGDSHAFAFCFGVDQLAKSMHLSGYLVAAASTPPLSGVDLKKRRIQSQNLQVLNFIQSHKEITTVILVAHWNVYQAGIGDHSDTGLAYGLRETVQQLNLMHRAVYITKPIPELATSSFNKAAFRKRLLGISITATAADTAYYNRTNRNILVLQDRMAKEHVANLIDVASPLRNGNHFMIEEAGKLLYMDRHHLSKTGSAKVAPAFLPALLQCRKTDTASLHW